MKQIFLTLALVLGFAFPATADEAKIRQFVDTYLESLATIQNESRETERIIYHESEERKAFMAFQKEQGRLLTEFMESDFDAYVTYLSAIYRTDVGRYAQLEENSAAYRTFNAGVEAAYTAVMAAKKLGAAGEEARAAELTRRENAAKDELVKNIMTLIATP